MSSTGTARPSASLSQSLRARPPRLNQSLGTKRQSALGLPRQRVLAAVPMAAHRTLQDTPSGLKAGHPALRLPRISRPPNQGPKVLAPAARARQDLHAPTRKAAGCATQARGPASHDDAFLQQCIHACASPGPAARPRAKSQEWRAHPGQQYSKASAAHVQAHARKSHAQSCNPTHCLFTCLCSMSSSTCSCNKCNAQIPPN